MDSTVIQEIANQLGMAVDQAGQLINEHLPELASLKAMQAAIPMIVVWAVFAVLAVVSITALALCYRWAKKGRAKLEEDEKNRKCKWFSEYRTHPDDYKAFHVFEIAGVCALTAAFCGILVTIYCAPYLYGWSNYPQAMLIDMALKAVG